MVAVLFDIVGMVCLLSNQVVRGHVEVEGGDAGTLEMNGGIGIHVLNKRYLTLVGVYSFHFESQVSPVARASSKIIIAIAFFKAVVITVFPSVCLEGHLGDV